MVALKCSFDSAVCWSENVSLRHKQVSGAKNVLVKQNAAFYS